MRKAYSAKTPDKILNLGSHNVNIFKEVFHDTISRLFGHYE